MLEAVSVSWIILLMLSCCPKLLHSRANQVFLRQGIGISSEASREIIFCAARAFVLVHDPGVLVVIQFEQHMK